MTPLELLEGLRQRGFQVDAAGQKLLVTPGSRLTVDDRACIRLCAKELLAIVEDEREWFEERAGILEYDGGLTRAEAEVIANELLCSLRQRARGAPA